MDDYNDKIDCMLDVFHTFNILEVSRDNCMDI